ncbi:sodium-dependent glucose transporter 1A-like [Ylistrum balloti]|uniref:sodium-dependent glucose transporter 1A-like n=1 Tax=Ylistrum balloti TaxID=509963 RepID=UPI002905CA91|nr:sodium-dependent glucose transporter 1A-like [Ylistrum balloti]
MPVQEVMNNNDTRSMDSGEVHHCGICCHFGSFTNPVIRYKKDKVYREKIIRTACLYLAMFTMGFAKSQLGPSLIDLQIISRVGLEEGSAFITAVFTGYMVGICVGGIIYYKARRTFTVIGGNVLLTITTLAIPWCSFYWLMLFVFSIFGFSLGVANSVTVGDLQGMWGKDGRPYMQGMMLMYAVGSAVGPLIAAGFLSYPVSSKFIGNQSDMHLCVGKLNDTTSSTLDCFDSEQYNISKDIPESTYYHTRGNTQLYLSFMFITIFSVLTSLAFMAFYISFERKIQNVSHGLSVISKKYETRQLPIALKFSALGMMICIAALISSIEEAFVGFLTTFCVIYLKWTKSRGAVLTSVCGFSVVFGRLFSVVIIQFINPMTLTGVHALITMLSFVGLYVSTLHTSTVGIYICAIGFGYGRSAILASVLSWIDEIVTPVTGKISALVYFVITSLVAINPVILGSMMENLRDIWYVLLLLGESVLLVIFYTAAALISKFIVARHGYTYGKKDNSEGNAQINTTEMVNHNV